MSYRVQVFLDYSELPSRYEALLGSSGAQFFFYRREWFDFLLRHVYDNAHILLLYAVEEADSGEPLMLVPLRYTQADSAVHRAHTVAALGHLENYAPSCFIVDPARESERRELMTCLFRYLRKPQHASQPAKADVVRLWPFEVDSALGDDVAAALGAAGFWIQRYANSHNTYEDCSNLSFDDYMAKRSSNQRYNNRRKRRNLEKEGELEFVMITDDSDTEAFAQAIDDYILVSVHSWKPVNTTVSSPMIELIRIAAKQGSLRLAIMRLDGNPIAAQFWILSEGIASMMRPNYHGAYARLSPGVVLTSFVIEYLLDTDGADSLDFGYGEDEYKGKWVDSARSYEGLMAFNPATPRGVLYGALHIGGQKIKRRLNGKPVGDPQPGAVAR